MRGAWRLNGGWVLARSQSENQSTLTGHIRTDPIYNDGSFDRWAGFWRSWTNRLTLFKNIEVDYLLCAARHTS